MAKTPEEKQEWLEAIMKERERRKSKKALQSISIRVGVGSLLMQSLRETHFLFLFFLFNMCLESNNWEYMLCSGKSIQKNLTGNHLKWALISCGMWKKRKKKWALQHYCVQSVKTDLQVVTHTRKTHSERQHIFSFCLTHFEIVDMINSSQSQSLVLL